MKTVTLTVKLLALTAVLALAACKAPPDEISVNRALFPAPEQAKVDLAAALKTAAATHKRILLDFGGNWCGDCLVLDAYFHSPTNLPILQSSFIVVPINIGQYDANLDIASQYDIPLARGVPAIAVLSDKGELLYSQRSGEFAPMHRLDPSAVTKFLQQWQPN